MKIETFEKFKKYNEISNAFRNFKNVYAKLKSNPNNDKLGYGFDKDQRFEAFAFQIHFSNYVGSYGNSSCSKFFSLCLDKTYNTELYHAFNNALNKLQPEIFELIAQEFATKAERLKEDVKAEIKSVEDLMEEV